MKQQPQQTLDLSFARAARVVPDTTGDVRIFLVGCGGTGGWLAPSVARLARTLIDSGRECSVTFVDDDRVEAGNIPRQNFCAAEVGLHKSVTLMQRLNAAWDVGIGALTEKFDPEMLSDQVGAGLRATRHDALTVIVGCVDNAKARRSIARALDNNMSFLPHCYWWLDCGNSKASGQVLLGSAPAVEHLGGALKNPKLVRLLPGPGMLAPELLKERPEERKASRMGCRELMALNMQSLMINQHVAAVAAEYLYRLVGGAPLRRFATYFDLETGTSRSLYTTPDEIARAAGCRVEYLTEERGAAAA